MLPHYLNPSRLAAVLVTIAAIASVDGQSFLSDFLVTPQSAVGMLPPVAVVNAHVERMSWSPSGRYLLVARRDPRFELSILGDFTEQGAAKALALAPLSLVVYDVAKGRSIEAWSSQGKPAAALRVVWMAGTDTAVVSMDSTSGTVPGGFGVPEQISMWTLVRVRAKSARSETLMAMPQDGLTVLDLIPAPKAPFALLSLLKRATIDNPNRGGRLFTIVRDDDASTTSIEVAGEPATWAVGWRADGRTPYLASPRHVDNSDGKAVTLDFASGKLTSLSVIDRYDPAPPHGDLKLEFGSQQARSSNATANLHPVWLASQVPGEGDRALASPDASEAILAPDGQTIAYMASGVALIRQLVRMDKAAWLLARSRQAQRDAMFAARSIATALLRYADEHDDLMPSGSEDLANLLKPYGVDPSALDGFIYTFRGGDINWQTVIGYIETSTGRATAFGDGHVMWKKT